MNIRFRIASVAIATIVGLVSGAAVSDVRVRLHGGDFVVEDRTGTAGTGVDNFLAQDLGAGSEISRSTISVKDGDNDGNSAGEVRFFEGSGATGTNSITLQAPIALGSDYTLTLPVDDGDDGQVLTTNGTGTLSWK